MKIPQWLKPRKKCSHCEKKIGFFKKVYRIENPTNEMDYYDMHEKCWLKWQINTLKENIKELENDLLNPNRINIDLILNARDLHMKNHKEPTLLTFGTKLYSKSLRDGGIKEVKYYDKKNGYLYGMKIVRDDQITGWYIK